MADRRMRRALVCALGVGALLPKSVCAQGSKNPRVGFLSARERNAAIEVPPFLEGMRELGYIEGKNIQYEWRFAEGQYGRLPALADELVRLKVDIIVASSSPAVRAARRATGTIPIVMQSVNDPVGSGFVSSFAQPGGNITGTANLVFAALEKQLDLLVDVVPKLTKVAFLINPDEPVSEADRILQRAATRHRLSFTQITARTSQEIEDAFVTMKRERCQGFILGGSAFFAQQRVQIAALATKARLPGSYYRREYVEAGGLMSYGRNPIPVYRHAANYVDKILKGARPAELPIEQPTVIELAINRKAADAIGIKFPAQVVVRANKIIE